jgi:hypothetical protein
LTRETDSENLSDRKCKSNFQIRKKNDSFYSLEKKDPVQKFIFFVVHRMLTSFALLTFFYLFEKNVFDCLCRQNVNLNLSSADFVGQEIYFSSILSGYFWKFDPKSVIL